MAAVDWATPLAAVNTALLSTAGDDTVVGGEIASALAPLGALYAANYNGATDASRVADDAAYAAAFSTWVTSTGPTNHSEADHACRFAESLQVTAQAALAPPANLLVGDFVLAPSKSRPFGSTEAPAVAASLVLLKSGTPALRVVAKAPGIGGNVIEVSVVNSTSGNAANYNLLVRFGLYVETYQEIPGAGPAPSLSASKLLADPAGVFAQRPDNIGYTVLALGAGNSLAGLLARIDAVSAFSAVGDDLRFTLAEQRRLVIAAYARKPAVGYRTVPHINGQTLQANGYTTVFDLETALLAQIAKANTWLAQIAF